MASLDPLSEIQNAIWAMLEGHSGFTDLVPIGNRVKFTKEQPFKEESSSADHPEVRVVPTSTDIGQPRTTNSTSIVASYEIQIATGDFKLTALLFPVFWEIIRAVQDYKSYFGSLTWGAAEKPIVVPNVRMTDASLGVLFENLNRGIRGWAAIMTLRCELFMANADMAP